MTQTVKWVLRELDPVQTRVATRLPSESRVILPQNIAEFGALEGEMARRKSAPVFSPEAGFGPAISEHEVYPAQV